MTLQELKQQLAELGASEVKISTMHEVFIVRIAWPSGVAVSAVDTDVESAVAAAVVLGARRGGVS